MPWQPWWTSLTGSLYSSRNTRLCTSKGTAGFSPGRCRRRLGVGNQLLLSDELLRKNTRAIQERNEIDIAVRGAPLEAWPLAGRLCPHFSVEMETGRARHTSICARSMSWQHGTAFASSSLWCRALPSAKACSRTSKLPREHFKALYNLEPQSFVYDGKKVSRLAPVRHQQQR